jgi:uncharacterized protein (TIGR00251 family)
MRQAENGIITLKLKVIPNAKKTSIEGAQNGELVVKVNAAPEDGKANKALIALLATRLGIAKSAVSIGGGEHSRHKTVLLASSEQITMAVAKLYEKERS